MRVIKNRDAHIFEREEHDHYVEPIWCSSRLFEKGFIKSPEVHDPACGWGHIVASARVHGKYAGGSDIVIRSRLCDVQCDFLAYGEELALGAGNTALVSNPPFKYAREFIEKALELDFSEIAFFLPSDFQYGDETSRFLEKTPLAEILAVTPRPSCLSGDAILAGGKIGGATKNSAWYIWRRGHVGPPVGGWLRRED